MSKVPDLEYYTGKKMNLTPSQYHPTKIAADLDMGIAPFVRLEPGDGTRYDFFLIPIEEDSDPAFSHGLHEGRWIYLAPVNLYHKKTEGSDHFIRLDPIPARMRWEIGSLYSNEWTIEVICHYLALVAEQLEG